MDSTPDWVRESLHQSTDELRMFLRTACVFTMQPRRFAAEWADQRRRALNPLGFFATAFAIIGATDIAFARLTHSSDAPTAIDSLLGAGLPFVYYVILGIFSHAILRLFGSKRPLRGSCAMALYAGGGPMLASHALTLTATIVLAQINGHVEHSVTSHTPHGWIVLGGMLLAFVLFLVTLLGALAGLHCRDGIAIWQTAVALLLAIIIAGFLFDAVKPPGEYGLHPVIGFRREVGSWNLHYGLSDG
jgi:hypothetical protein